MQIVNNYDKESSWRYWVGVKDDQENRELTIDLMGD